MKFGSLGQPLGDFCEVLAAHSPARIVLPQLMCRPMPLLIAFQTIDCCVVTSPKGTGNRHPCFKMKWASHASPRIQHIQVCFFWGIVQPQWIEQHKQRQGHLFQVGVLLPIFHLNRTDSQNAPSSVVEDNTLILAWPKILHPGIINV